MSKQLIKRISEHVEVYRDVETGLVWVEDGSTGSWHSSHANIDATGSVRGMKNLGYWKKDARTVRAHGYIYNIDSCVITDEYDQIANDLCRCGGVHAEKVK